MTSMENTVGKKTSGNTNSIGKQGKGNNGSQGKDGNSTLTPKCKVCGKHHKGKCWYGKEQVSTTTLRCLNLFN